MASRKRSSTQKVTKAHPRKNAQPKRVVYAPTRRTGRKGCGCSSKR